MLSSLYIYISPSFIIALINWVMDLFHSLWDSRCFCGRADGNWTLWVEQQPAPGYRFSTALISLCVSMHSCFFWLRQIELKLQNVADGTRMFTGKMFQWFTMLKTSLESKFGPLAHVLKKRHFNGAFMFWIWHHRFGNWIQKFTHLFFWLFH